MPESNSQPVRLRERAAMRDCIALRLALLRGPPEPSSRKIAPLGLPPTLAVASGPLSLLAEQMHSSPLIAAADRRVEAFLTQLHAISAREKVDDLRARGAPLAEITRATAVAENATEEAASALHNAGIVSGGSAAAAADEALQRRKATEASHASFATRRVLSSSEDGPPALPSRFVVLDEPGMARELSLPPWSDSFSSVAMTSYRTFQGILHNPEHDRRTTAGVFHVVDLTRHGGLPVPSDKKAVPVEVFLRLVRAAFKTTDTEALTIPYTAAPPASAGPEAAKMAAESGGGPVKGWLSLLLRPVVVPKVAGFCEERRMEVRIFAPGSLAATLDFVESVFGCAGDARLLRSDAALDPLTWSGHTGCIVIAPHIRGLTKKELGLPHVSEATERQKHDQMYWTNPEEKYNDGVPFKLTVRTSAGTVMTLISDSYFGYAKKEVKTMISMAANLHGMAEEEHAGGVSARAAYDLGDVFSEADLPAAPVEPMVAHTLRDVVRRCPNTVEVRPEGYAIDRRFPTEIAYVPEGSRFDRQHQRISWPAVNSVGPAALAPPVRQHGLEEDMASIYLAPNVTYILPSGYQVRLARCDMDKRWHLIGTVQEGVVIHKPCTVSGGGKSELSKSLSFAIQPGRCYVADFASDFAAVEAIVGRDYSGRFADPAENGVDRRPILSARRTIGSVVKLLSPSPQYSQDYLKWLNSIPPHVRDLVFVVKSVVQSAAREQGLRALSSGANIENQEAAELPEAGSSGAGAAMASLWRPRFSVAYVNGRGGNELLYDENAMVTRVLRVGHAGNGHARTFTLRPDFREAAKLQIEDDITAAVTVPLRNLSGGPAASGWAGWLTAGTRWAWSGEAEEDRVGQPMSTKMVQNVERRLFQRPDDAKIRGYDRLAELDIARQGVFLTNFEPLKAPAVAAEAGDVLHFGAYSGPMRKMLSEFLEASRVGKTAEHLPTPEFCVSSAHARIVNGAPTRNPRYLQTPQNEASPIEEHLAIVASRLARGLPEDAAVPMPVSAVLCGRRNNARSADGKFRPLAAHNPIHYLERPELFAEFISSMTGASPSTTGAGSEGAMTKGPFNCLPLVGDVNSALISLAVSGYDAFLTSAGVIGPTVRVDHDISLLVPEVWARMTPTERNARWLMAHGHLEPCPDLEYKGRVYNGRRLGHRVTRKFADTFLGRVFTCPLEVWTDEMLRPEVQSLESWASTIDTIEATDRRVAELYFKDGTVVGAVPPLQILLAIMAGRGEEADKYAAAAGIDVSSLPEPVPTSDPSVKSVGRVTMTTPAFRKLFSTESIMSSDWYMDRLKARQAVELSHLNRGIAALVNVLTCPERRGAATVAGLDNRLQDLLEMRKRVSSDSYVASIRGTLGSDPWLHRFLGGVFGQSA